MNLINKVYSLALGSACLGGLAPAYVYLNKVDAPTEVFETEAEVVANNHNPSRLEWVKGEGLGGAMSSKEYTLSPM